MDIAWWLLLAVAAVWQLRQGIPRLRAASRSIDDDIAAFSHAHHRAVVRDDPVAARLSPTQTPGI
jgi:hypothetical protein